MSRMRLVKNPSSQFFDNGRHVTLEKRKLRPLRSHNANSCELLNLRSPRFKRASISERIVFFNGGHWLPHGVWIAAKRRCSSRRLGSSVLAHAGGHHAKPLHPRATNVLYLMYLGTCLVERTWRFALPLVLAFVEGGYQAIALVGFVSPLGCSLFGPAIGRLLDQMYRPYGLGLMIGIQGLAVIGSGLLVLMATMYPAMSISTGPLFAALLILSMLERLTAISSELAIERDWVTQLSGKENAYALARSNAMLRRTDLTCELIGSVAFGWLYSHLGSSVAVASTTILAVVMLPAQLACIYWIARIAPDAMVHGREDVDTAMFRPPWKRLLKRHDGANDARLYPEHYIQRARTNLARSLDGWKTYFRQPILPSSLTFVLLFFNVALSPGGLITAFLTAKGLDGTGMAIFRGGCAVMGFLGTWVGRQLIQQYGLLGAGKRALGIQCCFLGVATLIYSLTLSQSLPGSSIELANGLFGKASMGLIAFSAAVVASRVGMWSYDMVNAQLFQQNVSQRQVASASAAEMALCSSSELIMLGLAAYVITPDSFSALIFGSFGAVIAANVLFNWWVSRVRGGDEELSAALTAAA